MKRCPECRRDYYDDTLLYCLEDGVALVQGSVPAPSGEMDGPATVILHSTAAPGEAPTRAQINTNDETAIPPAKTGEVSKPNSDKRFLAIPLILVAVVLAGWGVFRFVRTETGTAATFEKIKNTRMTKSGNVIMSALSPDGKYFAHVISTDGQQTLFVRQTAANNDITVVPMGKVEYWGITFSKDSNDLFYAGRDHGGISILYRIPALGGDPKKIIEGVDCPVTFSPDGRQMAFVRGDFPNKDESALMIANSDGTGEKVLASRKTPQRFYPMYFAGPSWSPDGKMIAAAVSGIGNDLNFKVFGFNVGDGKETEITKQEFGYIGRVEWLADGKNLLIIARESGATYRQIWRISYPESEAKQITNEFKDHRSLSLTADSAKLVTVQTDRLVGAFVSPISDIDQARQILQPTSEGPLGAWTSDGKILYFNDTFGDSNIWLMNADGSAQRQLTSSGGNSNGAASRDGNKIAFESSPNGSENSSTGYPKIWIMDKDGGNPKQLTNGASDRSPVFSVDGKWIFYVSYATETLGIWKVPIEGGASVRVAEGRYLAPMTSPDGKSLAAIYLEKPTTPDQLPNKIAILSVDGGVPLKTFDIQYNPTTNIYVIWSADSKSIIYNQVKDNISNLWSQATSGGPPKQISDFKDGLIYAFDLSHDGKQMLISRGPYSRDAVLISNDR